MIRKLIVASSMGEYRIRGDQVIFESVCLLEAFYIDKTHFERKLAVKTLRPAWVLISWRELKEITIARLREGCLHIFGGFLSLNELHPALPRWGASTTAYTGPFNMLSIIFSGLSAQLAAANSAHLSTHSIHPGAQYRH